MDAQNPDIIIIDDDPMVGELSKDLLTDEGYNVLLLQDSMEAIATVKANKPRLIITDIMMPGISGMEICKAVRSDPTLKDVKIIVVSGKSYQIEKQRAFQLGADFFLQKPYNVDTFSKTVKSILEDSADKAPAPPPSAPVQANIIREDEPLGAVNDLQENQVRLTIWGARGLPLIIPNSPSKYGRQTSCMSVETRENIFVFDAGTGIITLGKELLTRKSYYKDIWLFITHFHLDHIIGMGQFAPIEKPEYKLHIVGANDPEKSLREMAQSSFYSSFSLVNGTPKAKINLYEVLEDNYELLPGVMVRTMYANHPTNTLIYSLEVKGKKILYAPDSEIWGDATALQDYDEKFGIFSQNSDVFIHDATFDDEDYEKNKKQGHSGLTVVVDFAAEKAQAKELILFHLNPDYNDERLEKMIQSANTEIQTKGYNLKVSLPQEGTPLLLTQ